MANENEAAAVAAEDGGAIVEIADGTVTSAPAPAAPPKVAEAPVPEVVIVPEPAPAAPVSEGVEELRAQLRAREDRDVASNQERQRIQEHNRQLQEANQRYQEEVQRAQSEALDSRRSEIDFGIAAAQAEVESARRQYKAALEAGDFENASEANVKVNEAASSLVYLKHRKAEFEIPGQRPIVNPQGRVEAPAPQRMQEGDPTERYIAEKSPRTGAWLRKHMECVTDPRTNKRTVAAHFEAEAEGYIQDTDAYFDFLDKKLGFSQAAPRVAEEPRRSPAARPVPPAAPVSREAPRAQELGNGRIYLTKGELETAEALGITPAEYGKRKQAMTKQGFYNS